VACHLEWDLLAGPMLPPMLILTLAFPTRYGCGGEAGEVAGEAAGVVVEAAALAGAGLCPIGIPGGRTVM